MAYDHSAAVLGAADSQIVRSQEAHDMLPIDGRERQERETIRGATEAIRASQSLNSPTIERTPSPHDLEIHPPTPQDSSHDGFASGSHVDSCVTTPAHERVNGNQAAPSPIVPPSQLPRDSTPPATPPSTKDSTLKCPASAIVSQTQLETPLSNTVSSQQSSLDGGTGPITEPHEGNMLFSYRAPGHAPAAHRRRQYANTSALTDYEADLTGKDRAKQKEAVRKLLMERVRDDWKWVWPRPPPDSDSDLEPSAPCESEPKPKPKPESEPEIKPEDESRLSPARALETEESQQESAEEEYEEQWKERDEWLSNASDSEEQSASGGAKKAEKTQIGTKDNPFRFETPDGILETVQKTSSDRKQRRKKRLAEEMAWNDGVRCFNERRDAWTGARRVTRSIPRTPTNDLRQSTSRSSQDGGSSTAMDPETEDDAVENWEADTEIPVAPPLIPPENAMRASITPTAYNTIYDKVILQNLSPSCPINLKDITRSCVQGWKRDGEWPPKSSVPDTQARGRRRKSLASLFGLEKTKSKDDKEKVGKEKAEKEVSKESDDPKPGAFKKFTRKLLLLGGKDKDHEHGKEAGTASNGGHGRKESVAEAPAT